MGGGRVWVALDEGGITLAVKIGRAYLAWRCRGGGVIARDADALGLACSESLGVRAARAGDAADASLVEGARDACSRQVQHVARDADALSGGGGIDGAHGIGGALILHAIARAPEALGARAARELASGSREADAVGVDGRVECLGLAHSPAWDGHGFAACEALGSGS